jgi:peptidoglycan/LPS O-acetylase OafA/YrhL
MNTPALSARLDMLRWMAAFMVVLSHMRPLLFVKYEEVENKNIFIKLFYFVTGFGHESVMVFFVISGLLVGGVSARKFAERRFSARSYVVHRFARIYLVFLPALLAGYLLDTIGSAYLDASGIYSNTSEYRFSADAVDHLGTMIALGNMAMLQEIFFPPLGSNGPLWSLAYEWWYYILFFCGLQMLLLRDCPWKRATYGIVLGLSVFLLPLPILLWFPIWLTGVAVALCANLKFHVPRLFGYAFFIGALAWSRYSSVVTVNSTMVDVLLRDVIVAAGCFALFLSLTRPVNQPLSGAYEGGKVHAPLAAFSYTLYLVHVPFLLFGVALLNVVFGVPFAAQPTLAGMLYFALLLFAIYAYAYAFSCFTEKHTDRFRRYLSRRLVPATSLRMPESAPAGSPD